MPRTIPLAQYIFSRLRQLGCHSVHGVPGDFTLRALDYLPASKVNWIGNANELCAGYAADGYARAAAAARRAPGGITIPKVGAVCTTYGVGELSAVNAIAGSYAESVPVVHLVGTPSRSQWRSTKVVHHSLGDGNLGIYAEIAKKFSVAQADLSCDDIYEAVDRVDRALEQCVKQSRPAYVNLPSDMISKEVAADLLEQELDLDLVATSEVEEDSVVELIVDRIRASRRPLILADGLSYSWDLVEEANAMAQLTEMPTFCFSAGKGVINEDLPSWRGPLTAPSDYSATTDLALLFGPLLSDTNTAAWTAVPDPDVSIFFNRENIQIASQVYNAPSKNVLCKLITRLQRDAYIAETSFLSVLDKPAPAPTPVIGSNAPITQDALWQRMSSWLRPHDTVLLANGTPLIGGREMNLPSPVQVIASGIWCSIGQMLPAAQGVAAARRDHNIPGRTILFEGDGSFQVTCQSISDIIRHRSDVTIVMCNNAGYTYERLLHGMDAEYNDVPAWRHVDAAKFFGAGDAQSDGYRTIATTVNTWAQLEELLADGDYADGKGLTIIEVIMDPQDVPQSARAGLKRASDALNAM